MEYVILGTMALEKNRDLALAFGRRVREVRKSRGMSMQQLADEINVEYRQIARIEAGEVNTSLQMAYGLAKVLRLSLSQLLDFVVEDNPPG